MEKAPAASRQQEPTETSRLAMVARAVHEGAGRPDSRPRICYVMTAADSTVLLRGQLAYLRANGFDVELVCSPGDQLQGFLEAEGVSYHPLRMRREMRPFDDLRALLQLYRHLRESRPDIVNASTPKAGLLGMVAAWLAGTPVRIYVLRGLRLETTRGLQRAVLKATETIAAWCSNRVVCVGEGLRDAYVRMGLTRRDKTLVIGAGTSNGVAPTCAANRNSASGALKRQQIRSEWGLPQDALVFGVIGRITADKGIVDMLRAFDIVAEVRPEARLVLIGNYEEADPVGPLYRGRIESDPRILATGFVREPSRLFNAIDVVVHPSLREGFPNAPMEAAAAALPVVGRRVTGMTDAVICGETGMLVASEGHEPLASAMLRYASSPEIARQHGEAGRRRVQRDFSRERIWSGLTSMYSRLLGRRAPSPSSSLESQETLRAA